MQSEAKKSFPVIAIGASAGGFEAFREFVAALPDGVYAAYIFIQHLPLEHRSLTPGLLHKAPKDLRIAEAGDGMHPEPNTLYFPPQGKVLTFADGRFSASEAQDSYPRHSIDHLFLALARMYKDRAVGIILSGAGIDGTRGATEIRANGGTVLVQDPATAQFPDMPDSAVGSDSADMVLTVAEIAREVATLAAARAASIRIDSLTTPEHLHEFHELMQRKTGHRFHQYKVSVIQRRVRRRMQLRGFGDIEEYIGFLERDTHEAQELASDLMIGVTSFFRDAETWWNLKEQVLRNLAEQPGDTPIRVWTPACSTGEESYSIAIMMIDELRRAGNNRAVQVFATDINEKALETARRGVYTQCIESDVPAEYMKHYFVRSGKGAVTNVTKEIRDSIVFAGHDLLTDPPFLNLDLIICRNLLIYLEPPAQARCIDIFHYSLQENGCLFLGKAETVGDKPDHFTRIGPRDGHVYRRRPGESEYRYSGSAKRSVPSTRSGYEAVRPHAENRIVDAAKNALLLDYVPAAVAVDRSYAILYNSGPINQYLTPPQGKPTNNLLDQLPKRLRTRLRAMVERVERENTPLKLRTSMLGDDKRKKTTIIVSQPEEENDAFLLVFRESGKLEEAPSEPTVAEYSPEELSSVHALERELEATRRDLHAHIEQLRIANEELQSANEEHQAANEELETSREELQSLNEELVTVNSQLQSKMAEQEEINSDLVNFQTSTDIPALFLGLALAVRRFTPAMSRLVSMRDSDIGRNLTDFSQEKLGPYAFEDAHRVLEEKATVRREVRIHETAYIRAMQPYRTPNNRIGGVVITWSDITEQKNTEEELRQSHDMLRIVADFTYDWEYWLRPDGTFAYITPSCERVTGYRREEFQTNPELYSAIVHPEDRREVLDHLTCDTESMEPCEFQFRIIRKDGTHRWIGHVCQRIVGADGTILGRRSSNRDITETKQKEQEIAQSEKRFHAAVDNYPSPFIIYGPDRRIRHINKAGRAVLQRSEDEIIGHLDEELLPPEVSENYVPFLKEVYREKQSRKKEVTVRLGGNTHTYLVDYVPLLDVSGEITQVLGITVDITEKRRAAEALAGSEQRMRIAAAAADQGVFEWDATTDTTKFENDRMFEILGLPTDSEPTPKARFVKEFLHPDDVPAFEAALAEGMGPNPQFHSECRIFRKDTHQLRWVEFYGRFESVSDELPTRLVGVLNDITDRVLAEEERRSEQELLHTIFESIPVMLTIQNPDRDILLLNKSVYETTGWSEEEVHQKGLTQLVYPDPEYRREVSEYMNSLKGGFQDVRMMCKDGSVKDTSWANIRIPDGRRVGIGIDITERKRFEARLRESEQQFRNMFERHQAVMLLIEPDSGKIVDANDAAATYYGYSREDLRSMAIQQINQLTPDEVAAERKKAVRERRGHFIFRHLKADNRISTVEVYSTPISMGEQTLLFSIVHDITSRKQAEEERERLLKEAEEGKRILDALLRHVPEGIIITEGVDKPVTVSRMLGEWTGGKMRAGLGFGSPEFIESWGLMHPDEDTPITPEELPIMRVLTEGRPIVNDVWRQRSPSGIQRYLSANAGPILDRNGTVKGCVVAWRDVTEARENEERMRQSEERFRTMADNISQFAWMMDKSGWIFWYNKRWYEYTGTTLEEMEGWGWTKVHHPEHVDRVVAGFRKAIESGTPWEDLFPLRSKTGEYRWFLSRAVPIRGESGDVVRWFGTNTDITEQRRIEEELRQLTDELTSTNQELEAFTYSVSHDLRAPLRSITSFSDFLQDDYSHQLDDQAMDFLNRIKRGGEKMNTLIDDLLGLSRISRQEMIFQQVDLSRLADGIAQDIRQSEPERNVAISIRENMCAYGDARLLDRALSNLLLNAWKYTGKTEAPEIEFGCSENGNEHIFFVRDNGAGFNAEKAEKLFMPFQRFHKESEFSGTGVGLAIVARVIKRHGGRIWAESSPGEGATFFFTLPRSARQEDQGSKI